MTYEEQEIIGDYNIGYRKGRLETLREILNFLNKFITNVELRKFIEKEIKEMEK